MLIYKVTLSLLGDNFYPEELLRNIDINLEVTDCHNPNDFIDVSLNKKFGFGLLMLSHKRSLVSSYEANTYLTDYVMYLENNYLKLLKANVTDIEIYTEIYYSGDQCNFEIFDKVSMKKINSLGVCISFPVSVYHLKLKEMKQLLT